MAGFVVVVTAPNDDCPSVWCVRRVLGPFVHVSDAWAAADLEPESGTHGVHVVPLAAPV